MKNFIDLIGEKNHAAANNFIPKYVLEERLLDCEFHAAIKRDACSNFIQILQEKVEFTESTSHELVNLKVRADVYIFSPQEIKNIARDVDAEFAEWERRTANQLHRIQRLEKELADLQTLAIEISMCTPPPIIIVDNTRVKELEKIVEDSKGRADKHIENLEHDGRLLEERLIKKVLRIEELEYSLKGIQQETKEALDPFKPVKPEDDDCPF